MTIARYQIWFGIPIYIVQVGVRPLLVMAIAFRTGFHGAQFPLSP